MESENKINRIYYPFGAHVDTDGYAMVVLSLQMEKDDSK